MAKEKRLNPLGIKVLSLFFIDRVENYRAADGTAGKFALWFEEIYRELAGNTDTAGVHDGYFSQDKKGRLKNTDGTTQADNDTYRLIMRDKETLLSFGSPLRLYLFPFRAERRLGQPQCIPNLHAQRNPLAAEKAAGNRARAAYSRQSERLSRAR